MTVFMIVYLIGVLLHPFIAIAVFNKKKWDVTVGDIIVHVLSSFLSWFGIFMLIMEVLEDIVIFKNNKK